MANLPRIVSNHAEPRASVPLRAAGRSLPLHAPRPAALDERVHLVHREPVEVARNRVLQAARRHRELQRVLMRLQVLEAVNQAAREAVAAAHAIHDVRDLLRAQKLDSFTDIRELQRQLKSQGVEFLQQADESTTGPASFLAVDPDGNPILVDQHV